MADPRTVTSHISSTKWRIP